MKTLLLLVICVAPLGCFGMDRLSALSMLETGNNDRMVGRAGEISRYQILKPEWRSVTNSVRWTDPQVAKAVTLKLIDRRVNQFRAKHRREPSDFEFYVLWNAPAQVLVRGKVSKVVAERAERYANLCTIQPAQQPKPMFALALPAVSPASTPAVARLN
jgi:hypothetical protein